MHVSYIILNLYSKCDYIIDTISWHILFSFLLRGSSELKNSKALNKVFIFIVN